MKTIYGTGWFRAKKRLTEVWNEAQARRCHESREPYVALIEEDGRLVCYVEFFDGAPFVGFLDPFKREYMSYNFQETDSDQLFLGILVTRDFEGSTDLVRSGSSYCFAQIGHVDIADEDFATGALTLKGIPIDVSDNYEAYPDFGNYQSLIRDRRPSIPDWKRS